MKYIYSLFLVFSFIANVSSQELNCNIKINTPKLQTADPKIFQTLEKDLKEFVNNKKWSKDVFKNAERIDCSIIITITEEVSQNEFKAQATIQSSRPVFNSAYSTTMFNYVDKNWSFKYSEYDPMDFNEDLNQNELTSLIAYYSYIILGLDYDSYGRDGGNPFYTRAQSLVSDMQNSSNSGWRATDNNRNRYWIMENLTNSKYSKIHEIIYDYHRNGLDKMYENGDKGRNVITSSLEKLKKIFDENPGVMFVSLFLNAKSDELINLYAGSNGTEKQIVSNMLVQMDASNANNYKKIVKGN